MAKMPMRSAGGTMPPKGANINKKGSSGVYDKNPALPQFPHSMSNSTVPIKFAEGGPSIPAKVGQITNSARQTGTGSVAPSASPARILSPNKMRNNK